MPAAKTRLGIRGSQFTINGDPVFLYGISYYAGLGAPEKFIRQDLADIKKYGFNWIRIWANWPGSDSNISAIDHQGNARAILMNKLEWIIKRCDRKGIIVDVTLSHGDGIKDQKTYRHAVATLVTALKPYQNWYIDLANERDIRDKRFVSFEELEQLCRMVKDRYPRLLVTASAGNDISREDLNRYLRIARVDFICPHRPRNAASAAQTASKTREYLAMMKALGRVVPVNYQEPFRRGYTRWQPGVTDYVTDLQGALAAGAAGWCFHNGDQGGDPDGMPHRSFDLHRRRLFDQLDPVEMQAIRKISRQIKTR
ncbi:hypothetical protein [Compostibacter hankyongensis]|uniref:Glycoside hydrolase family 5 domain-containing protein n=1 Tax=Compostibacter hankyongensis TaxID=1007089 RepID=A0ABP8G8K5_9BACT